MKYFLVALLLFTHFKATTMHQAEEDQSPESYLNKKRKRSTKWVRVPNQDNNTTRKWAYVCQVCRKQVSDIVRHNRVHTGERPYKCSTCKHEFFESSACVNHICSHHPDLQRATYIVKFLNKEPYERLVKNIKKRRTRAVEKKEPSRFPDFSSQTVRDTSEPNLKDQEINIADERTFSESILLDLDQILANGETPSSLESTI